jgi:hypothetical protein
LSVEQEWVILVARRRSAYGPVRLAGLVAYPPSTIGKVLRRNGCSRLPRPPASARCAIAARLRGFAGTYVDANAVSTQTARAIGAAVEATVVDGGIVGNAAWTKGTAALVLAVRETARAEGVEETLVAEWVRSLPGLADEHARALRSGEATGWRWVAEMEEIVATFAAAGQPDGFHRAAAEIYRRY